MIYYKSTRGDRGLYTFSEAVLKGIAEDGGLFVPEIIPQFTLGELKLLSKKSYQEQAIFIFNLFQTNITENAIRRFVNKAYSTNFNNPLIAPVVHLKENQYFLELWHGPSATFKDLALQIMPLLFSESLNINNKTRIAMGEKPVKYLLLVATSGDTGKAALEGYKDKENIFIIILYPDNHVSKLQELQMVTQEGNNLAVYALNGDFDAVQTTVKEVFNDKKFNQELFNKYQILLSSANSINWGRLVPQIVYYVSSYIDLIGKNILTWGDQINITVPTGNFGNILAAFYAKKMGLPIKKLICASNTNNVLTEFLKTGVYDIKNRKLTQTPSPSMDILVASNIERLLFTITGSAEKVSLWMHELKKKRKFEVDNATKTVLQNEFYADWVSSQDCLTNIKTIYNKTNYLMDPHTSVAQEVAERYLKQDSFSSPMIICSTAHWAKFAKDVYRALKNHKEKLVMDEFKIIETITKFAPGNPVPKNLYELKNKIIKHKQKCEADQNVLEKKIKEFLNML
ncbi:MAG: threonine synthase [bacterium]|nr:threonine synthase [bacterium]